jgi:hypothetical protein
MNKEMSIDGGSTEIGGSNATPKVPEWRDQGKDTIHKSIAPPRPKMGWRAKAGMTAAAGFTAVLTACGVIGEAKTPNSSISPTPEGLGGTPTDVLPSATKTTTATETKTATPTEIPIFTEVEIKAMNPFDTSENLVSWPERFAQTQLHPELATDKEWQDEYQFVLAGREDKGILRTAANWNGNPMLQSLHNGLDWEADNIDEMKNKNFRIAITPVEKRVMIEDARKFGNLATTDKSVQTYKSEILGPILGRGGINSRRRPFDEVSGKLGLGTIGRQDQLLVDIKDTTDGYHILFSVTVYVGKGIALPKESKCLVANKSYSNAHGGSSIYILSRDVELDPLREGRALKTIDWEYLYAALGKEVVIAGGGYMGELQNKIGVSDIYCFSPDLNLEIANRIWFPSQP